MKQSLAKKVLLFLKRIPKGKAASYSFLAKKFHSHPRAIATILRHNKDPKIFPCYKIVMADGSIGGYSGSGGIKTKIRLLKKEGVKIEKGKVARRCMLKR